MSSMISEMQREMDDMMRVMGIPSLGMTFDQPSLLELSLPANLPPMPRLALDITEDDKAYHMSADVPGFSKNDIKVSVSPDGMLHISGEIKKEEEEGEGERKFTSRRMTSFSRRLRLPDNINADDIKASTKEGVLCITLPKVQKPELKPKEIPIS
jgi:HSP20 family protein